jgi:hypothetical protein
MFVSSSSFLLQIKNTTVKNHKYRLVFMASKETNDSCYIVTAFDKNRVQPAAPPRPEAIQVETTYCNNVVNLDTHGFGCSGSVSLLVMRILIQLHGI